MKSEEQETSRHDDGEVIVKLSSIICPRTLDYDAPLLSTRRSHITRSNLINPTSWADRVPFSWEQSPGKPKQRYDIVAHDDAHCDDHIVPPPKLPPARWHDQMIIDQNFASASAFGSDEDVDAIDVFSLGESTRVGDIDDEEEEEERTGIINDCGSMSPNFILKRFLPDASALAMSSSLALQGSGKNASFGGGRGDHVSKGCGIDFLLPWKSMKLKHCSLKSPVREGVNVINMKTSPSRKHSLRRRMNK